MKLFIPEIGTQITLSKNWEFKLFSENRNDTLANKLGLAWIDKSFETFKVYRWYEEKLSSSDDGDYANITFEKNTVLKIDRIYIRKGNKDYSSVTFWVKSGPYKGARFWAKLEDVNKIEFDI